MEEINNTNGETKERTQDIRKPSRDSRISEEHNRYTTYSVQILELAVYNNIFE
jgi:hypothetical protein